LPLIQNNILYSPRCERHPIKTGADNYLYTYLYKARKIAVVTIRYCFNEDNKENLADNKIQTHLVDFY
jgi:hypothetical protein